MNSRLLVPTFFASLLIASSVVANETKAPSPAAAAEAKPEAKWSESLVKTAISDELFDVEIPKAEKASIDALRALCKAPVDTEARVKEIRAACEKLAKGKKLSEEAREVVDGVKEELTEIEDDLKFAQSKRGKYVLAVNDYVQRLYTTLRKEARFGDVLVGAHSEKEILMVHGKVASDTDLEALKKMMGDHPSQWPVEYKVKVTPIAAP